jgi:hypothetical protein
LRKGHFVDEEKGNAVDECHKKWSPVNDARKESMTEVALKLAAEKKESYELECPS